MRLLTVIVDVLFQIIHSIFYISKLLYQEMTWTVDDENFVAQLRQSTSFELGAVRNNRIVSIPYRPCDCRGRYAFKPKSKLLEYLRTCNGWVEDDEGKYTLNYLLIILMVHLKEKKLLHRERQGGRVEWFLLTKELQEAISYGLRSIHVDYVRPLIACTHLEGHRYIFGPHPPFACPSTLGRNIRKLIHQTLGSPYENPIPKLISEKTWDDMPEEMLGFPFNPYRNHHLYYHGGLDSD